MVTLWAYHQEGLASLSRNTQEGSFKGSQQTWCAWSKFISFPQQPPAVVVKPAFEVCGAQSLPSPSAVWQLSVSAAASEEDTESWGMGSNSEIVLHLPSLESL